MEGRRQAHERGRCNPICRNANTGWLASRDGLKAPRLILAWGATVKVDQSGWMTMRRRSILDLEKTLYPLEWKRESEALLDGDLSP